MPTLSASRASHVEDLSSRAIAAGMSVCVFANSSASYDRLRNTDVPTLSTGENLGFAAAVNRAAANRPHTAAWIVVLNDDVEIESFASLAQLDNPALQTAAMVSFGDEPSHPIQGVWEVFLSVSMLGGLRRQRRRHVVFGEVSEREYAPFSVMAIRSTVWTRLGGLDERFPFSFEDADFGRRARDAGYRRLTISPITPIRHTRGETGRANIGRVLPAAVWGGFSYLCKWGVPRWVARAVCLAGLLLRIPLTPASKSPVREHVRGIFLAAISLITDKQPKLPPYDAS